MHCVQVIQIHSLPISLFTSPFYGQGLLLFESEEGLEDVVEGLRDSVPVPDLGVMLVRGGSCCWWVVVGL